MGFHKHRQKGKIFPKKGIAFGVKYIQVPFFGGLNENKGSRIQLADIQGMGRGT
jgi:hypothetical protein